MYRGCALNLNAIFFIVFPPNMSDNQNFPIIRQLWYSSSVKSTWHFFSQKLTTFLMDKRKSTAGGISVKKTYFPIAHRQWMSSLPLHSSGISVNCAGQIKQARGIVFFLNQRIGLWIAKLPAQLFIYYPCSTKSAFRKLVLAQFEIGG